MEMEKLIMSYGMLHRMVIFLAILSLSQAKTGCILFTFGDSNSDTGNGMSLNAGSGASDVLGRLFFHRETGRPCDGRLIIDFLCQNVSIPLLSAYMRGFDGDFHSGANFAVGGSTAIPDKKLCYGLPYQIQHFRSFKSIQVPETGVKRFIKKDGFRKAVYIIDIGQNDLSVSLQLHPRSVEKSRAVIPDIIKQIKSGIETLYKTGGRKFWIHSTGPLGCLPYMTPGPDQVNWRTDPNGCLVVAMNISRELNAQLHMLVEELRTTLPSSTIVYVDVFSIKYDLFVNYTKYGFETKFDFCTNTTLCPVGSKYIMWDTVHYTELANSIVAHKILSGAYSDPPIKFADLCKA